MVFDGKDGAETWRIVRCLNCPFDGQAFSVDATRCDVCGAVRPEVLLPDHGASPDSVAEGVTPVVVLPKHASCVLVNKNGKLQPVFWQKLLYKKQPFPDNFTDREKFLDYLLINTAVAPYSYRKLVILTAFINQPVCLVVIYVCVWRAIHRGERLDSDALLVIDSLLMTVGYAIARMLNRQGGFGGINFRRALILFGCVKAICPILQTLTSTFSDDSVALLTTIMFTVHLVGYDYPFIARQEERHNGSTALNAAMFGTVLLASRLSSDDDVFAFLFFGVIIFCLSLVLRRRIYQYSQAWHNFGLTAVLFIVAISMLDLVEVPDIVKKVFIGAVLVVSFVAPMLFIRSQKYKNDLRGPWDIPQVRVYQ